MKKLIGFNIFFLILVFLIFNFNNALIVNFPSDIDNDNKEYILSILNKAGFRNVKLKFYFFDKIFIKYYKKMNFKIEYSMENDQKSSIISVPYFATVDFFSTINRFDDNLKNKYFNDFKNGIEKDIKFLQSKELSLDKRILVNEKNASPLIFYKLIKFEVSGLFSKREYGTENKILSERDTTNSTAILGFAGDVAIEEVAKEDIRRFGSDYCFKEIKDILKMPDLMSVNLEFTVTERGEREKKSYTFRASEEEAKVISESPIDYVCTANNHTKDYGEIGIIDTISFLEKNKIGYSGSGKNITEAFTPYNLSINNSKISLFSICDVINESGGYETMKNFKAGQNNAGVAFYDLGLLSKLFSEEKNKGNLIIIQIHTGWEYSQSPVISHKKIAHEMIDIGADAVICHHPHVVNGVEIYKDKLIAYSLGDFLFDLPRENADEGIIIFLYLQNNIVISWSYYPTIARGGAVVIDKARSIEVENKFINLTKKLAGK